MKKILSSILAVCMLLSSFAMVSFAADPVKPVIEANDAKVGETVTVTVTVPANDGAARGKIVLKYDNTKLEAKTLEPGALLATAGPQKNMAYSENEMVVNWAVTGADIISGIANGGVALTATFEVKAEGAAEFSLSEFTLNAIKTGGLVPSFPAIEVTTEGTAKTINSVVEPEQPATGVKPVIEANDAKVGETVTVTVTVPANEGAARGKIVLKYDNTKLEAKTLEPGALLATAGPQKNMAYSENEMVVNWAVTGADIISGIANGGVALTATFEAKAAGTVEFSLSEFTLNAIKTGGLVPSFPAIEVTTEGTAKSITIAADEVVVNKYTVTYKIDGEVVAEYKDQVEGADFPVYTAPEKEGYTFSGWGTLPEKVTEDKTIEGSYTVNQYKITYVVDGTTVKEDTYDYGAAVEAYNYVAEDGYTFSGWDITIPATMPAENLTATGTVTKDAVKYTVTFKAEGAEDATIEVVEGEKIADKMVADAVKATFEFVGWFTEDGIEITADTEVTTDIIAIAKFARIKGDIDCDGDKDIDDAKYLLGFCILPDLYTVADDVEKDINDDGTVDSKDAVAIADSLINPLIYSLK